MGNRGNVQIKYSEGVDIYFYTHWSGSELNSIVKNALKRGKERWNDESYLARIIFSEMVKDDIEGITGFGISPYEVEAGSPKVLVNCKTQEIISISGNTFTFEEFIKLKGNVG